MEWQFWNTLIAVKACSPIGKMQIVETVYWFRHKRKKKSLFMWAFCLWGLGEVSHDDEIDWHSSQVVITVASQQQLLVTLVCRVYILSLDLCGLLQYALAFLLS